MKKNICDYSSDEMFYQDILASNDIKDATKQTYVFMLKKVSIVAKKPLCTSLLNANQTFKLLNKEIQSRASLKTIVASILAVLKWTGEKQRNKALFDSWYKHYKPIMQEINQQRNNNQPTDRQIENWISWEDILTKFNDIGRTQYGSDIHLLLGIYCLLKPRRQEDYYHVKIIKKYGQRAKEDESFIDIISKKPYIMIKHFKTVTSYDVWKKDIPEELVKIIKKNNKTHLFMSSDNEPFKNRNSFTKYSNRLLKKIFDRNITVNTLRHAYSTFRNQDRTLTIGERIEDAKDMGHSLETHMAYTLFPKIES